MIAEKTIHKPAAIIHFDFIFISKFRHETDKLPIVDPHDVVMTRLGGERCLALAIFDAFFYILHRSEDASKALMQGCKFTWKSAFSQMWWHYKDAFEYLITAGI